MGLWCRTSRVSFFFSAGTRLYFSIFTVILARGKSIHQGPKAVGLVLNHRLVPDAANKLVMQHTAQQQLATVPLIPVANGH